MPQKKMTERDFMLQVDWRRNLLSQFISQGWVKLYYSHHEENEHITLYSALIPKNNVPDIIGHNGWDDQITWGRPGFTISYDEQHNQHFEYEHFNEADSIMPLVIVRTFWGVKDSYTQLLEEFVLYHNLYHDFSSNKYIKFRTDGSEHIVAKSKKNLVEVRLKELRQFAGATDMVLALYFVVDRFSSNLVISDFDESETQYINETTNYLFSVVSYDFESKKTMSEINGKTLIEGLPIEQSIVDEFEDINPNSYEEFIIDTDINGDEILFSYNPTNLANYFGKNLENPLYVTPVFFRKDILTRYYAEPSKYQVDDGLLSCSGLWSIRIDNNHTQYIIVHLGDLGYIPYSEQRIWRSYNIAPDGTFSHVMWKRNFLGQFTNPADIALIFKQDFRIFQDNWKQKYSWNLFKPLSTSDKYHFKILHIPLLNDFSEFDDQVLALTKLLIDSLNEKKIKQMIVQSLDSNTKGISKLEIYLSEKDFPETNSHIAFLRRLQEIRSKSSAHRKSRNFDKDMTRLDIDEANLPSSFEQLLKEAIDLLDSLTQYFL